MTSSRTRVLASLIQDEKLKESFVPTDSAVTSKVYNFIDDLPLTNNTTGDQAYVKASNRLYIWNGSGWTAISLINLSPTWDSEASTTYTFATDGTSIVIEIIARDSDGPYITYNATTDSDFDAIGTITKDSDAGRRFVATPLDSDGGTQTSGTGTVTFTATDGINNLNTVSTFSITFSSVVADSAETVFLMKASGNSAVNSAITYQNASDVSTGFTETDNGAGGPQASTFSPYRSGGYSFHGDGTGDYLSFAETGDNGFTFGTGDFTFECWYYPTALPASGNEYVVTFGQGNVNDHEGFLFGVNANGKVYGYIGNGSSWTALTGGSAVLTANDWYHLAIARSGTSLKIFVNGVEDQSVTNSTNIPNANNLCQVGGRVDSNGSSQQYVTGYLRDVRIVKGSAVYTSAFTPPTESLTAISGTTLLTCHLPYFADGSSTGHAVTVNGNAHTVPFGPYDYEPWNSTDFIGSVYVHNTDQLEISDYSTVADFGANDFTAEGWFYSDNTTQTYQFFFSGRATGTYRLIVFGLNNQIQVYLSTSGNGWTHSNTNCGTIREKNWQHIALVRNGGTLTLYVDGKGTNVTTSLGTGTLAAPTAFFIGSDWNSAYSFGGYISDARVVKGTAVYSSDFTPPTAPLTAVTNTQLLMQNKTDANVYDASASRGLRLAGDTVSSTTQRKFSTSSSVYFDGTGDYAISSDDATLEFKNGDFTIELWMYKTSTAASVLVQKRSTGSATGDWTLLAEYAGTDFEFWSYDYNSFGSVMLQGGTISQNTWHHVAVTRYGNTWTMWVDGTSVATLTSTITIGDGSAPLTIGRDNYGSGYRYFPGYIQDLRITKGLARYTSNFTLPTAEFEL